MGADKSLKRDRQAILSLQSKAAYQGQGQPTYTDKTAESAESAKAEYGGSEDNLRAPHYVANRRGYQEYR